MTTLYKRVEHGWYNSLSPSHLEWALLLLALVTAVILRFYHLGELPPGLYRDEAFNGLDALKVLGGDLSLFFQANNGREPLYIYLTALAVALFGQTALAVRLAAAVIGSVTTIPVYMLGKSWFGAIVGVLAAWLWAVTLWPIHLSRIGLRVILLVPLLALTFWLGTLAYRRQKSLIWLAAGVIYGFSFYSYLAARFTPILLLLLLIYLVFTGRGSRLWPGAAWFTLGAFISLLPFISMIIPQPELFLGRTGQVSVLHPDVNGGDLWGTLARQVGAALGMFLWQGDWILRHNPAGRPVYDFVMAIPFLIGLVWCIRRWHSPAAMTVLLWVGCMLGPTILAEDAPHFLRAVGILPVILYFPALGLDRIWRWNRYPRIAGTLLVSGLIFGSLLITIRDYTSYGHEPELDDVFETAAARLAQQINDEALGTTIYLDQRLWSGWPSISFLISDPDQVQRFSNPDNLPKPAAAPVAIYSWPYESLDYVPEVLAAASLVTVNSGDQVPGVLDNPPYTLFVRYRSEDRHKRQSPIASFGDQLQLHEADAVELKDGRIQVNVYWQGNNDIESDLVMFIHVLGEEGLIGQDDAPLARGRWVSGWWRPDLLINDQRTINLDEPYDPAQHEILLGVYRAGDGQRLQVNRAEDSEPMGTTWSISEGGT